MGPPERLTGHSEKQEGRRKRLPGVGQFSQAPLGHSCQAPKCWAAKSSRTGSPVPRKPAFLAYKMSMAGYETA
jgi:hypothetical protein